MMRIDSYAFGNMEINGKKYTSDLIILPDNTVIDQWWRRQGHGLVMDDLESVVKSLPATLIVGTGKPGLMKPAATLLDDLGAKGITAKVMPTQKAVLEFNRQKEQGASVAACFHLTC